MLFYHTNAWWVLLNYDYKSFFFAPGKERIGPFTIKPVVEKTYWHIKDGAYYTVIKTTNEYYSTQIIIKINRVGHEEIVKCSAALVQASTSLDLSQVVKEAYIIRKDKEIALENTDKIRAEKALAAYRPPLKDRWLNTIFRTTHFVCRYSFVFCPVAFAPLPFVPDTVVGGLIGWPLAYLFLVLLVLTIVRSIILGVVLLCSDD